MTESTGGLYCFNICFLISLTQLEITKIQANYWWGQMHCGPPNQNFGWTPRCSAPHGQIEYANIVDI